MVIAVSGNADAAGTLTVADGNVAAAGTPTVASTALVTGDDKFVLTATDGNTKAWHHAGHQKPVGG